MIVSYDNEALFQSLQLQKRAEKAVKASLLAVTLWFRHGSHPQVLSAVRAHLKKTPSATWLPAIPQLIARLGAKDIDLRESLIEFLLQLATSYPDALIWPLLTASQTPMSIHQEGSLRIMRELCALPENTKMVQQAQIVGRGLLSSAISPCERWKNALERVRIHELGSFRQ